MCMESIGHAVRALPEETRVGFFHVIFIPIILVLLHHMHVNIHVSISSLLYPFDKQDGEWVRLRFCRYFPFPPWVLDHLIASPVGTGVSFLRNHIHELSGSHWRKLNVPLFITYAPSSEQASPLN